MPVFRKVLKGRLRKGVRQRRHELFPASVSDYRDSREPIFETKTRFEIVNRCLEASVTAEVVQYDEKDGVRPFENLSLKPIGELIQLFSSLLPEKPSGENVPPTAFQYLKHITLHAGFSKTL
nr:hypothetical protein [Parvularcula oceani]